MDVIMLLAEAKTMKEKPKKAFAEELAKKMAEETTSQHRTAAQFQSKVDSIATQWCAAHEWAQATGAGLKERRTQPLLTMPLKRGCPHYFLLLDIMKDRTSTQPLATSGMDPPGKTKIMSKRLMIIYQNKLFCLMMMTLVLLLPISTCLLLTPLLLMQRQIKTPSMQPKQKTTSSSASMSDASFYGGDLAVASVMAQSAVNRKKQKQAAFAEHLRHNKRWIFFFFFCMLLPVG
jgi:hypothetical protein